ncbi:MAG TPA: hypothetical protein VF623_02285 [Segetibacter sp.]
MLTAKLKQGRNENNHEEIKRFLLQATCIFWLVEKLITWKLWTSNRLYPVTPVFEIFGNIPSVFYFLLLITSFVCLISLFLSPQSRVFLFVLLFAEILTCLGDYNRLQPWEYQYIFTVLIFTVYNKNKETLIAAIAFIIACTYFYSGINKFSTAFLYRIWNNMILIRFFKINKVFAANDLVHYSGFLLPAIEVLCSIALLFNRTKRISAIVLITMHLFNLLLLGPLGLKYNPSVWPWNVAMIFFLNSIFLSISITFRPLIKFQNSPLFLLWGLLPALNTIGKWDDYLSSNLYTGKTMDMMVCFKSNNNVYPLCRFKS